MKITPITPSDERHSHSSIQNAVQQGDQEKGKIRNAVQLGKKGDIPTSLLLIGSAPSRQCRLTMFSAGLSTGPIRTMLRGGGERWLNVMSNALLLSRSNHARARRGLPLTSSSKSAATCPASLRRRLKRVGASLRSARPCVRDACYDCDRGFVQ